MSKNGMTKRAKSRSEAKATSVTAKIVQSGMIRARISPDLKAEAESILSQIGLSSSDAIRMSYKQRCAKGCRSRRESPTQRPAKPCATPGRAGT
jgi:hypothetical protein